MSTTAKWLSDEDSRCFDDRLSRLEWLVDNAPAGEHWLFPWRVARQGIVRRSTILLCVRPVPGEILLGLAYIEQTLAALFYGAAATIFSVRVFLPC